LDENFWKSCVLEESLKILGLSKEVDGILLERELYGGGGRYSHGCFCDHCFYKFLEYVGSSKPKVPTNARYKWLAAKGYIEEYYCWAEALVHDMFKYYTEKLLALKEDLVVGFYDGGDLNDFDWYIRGLMRGVNDAGTRLLILDPVTY